jgi:hypothetical protein
LHYPSTSKKKDYGLVEQPGQEINFSGEKETSSWCLLLFVSFDVEVTSLELQYKAAALLAQRIGSHAPSWQHSVEEEKVSTPCHLQGMLL